ncbi:uncharacterized protein RAG0_03063 [Rhynchosporium agropyri]|uniref:Uncharacterized protein n=1 Tax=Rhynchosporium agropyri TaxID=914238 RepID=A0A1E1K3N1_9HELO|nr:uncharacterized protein RAG0_03063 [Rhynchosporium agropyri]
MALKVASKDPPMTLSCRQELQKLCISFRILPHEIVFTPRLGDIISKQQLCDYVDALLEDLAHQYPTTVSPKPGMWKLVRADADMDLDKWDPRSLELDKPLFITSNIKPSHAVIASATALHNVSWVWADGMMSVCFPGQGAFVLEGYNRVFIVLRCQTKFRVSNKKKRIDETSHNMFIPMTYTVQDVLRLIQASNVCGVFQEPHESNLRWSGSSASELGWKHGSVLRLELW